MPDADVLLACMKCGVLISPVRRRATKWARVGGDYRLVYACFGNGRTELHQPDPAVVTRELVAIEATLR